MIYVRLKTAGLKQVTPGWRDVIRRRGPYGSPDTGEMITCKHKQTQTADETVGNVYGRCTGR